MLVSAQCTALILSTLSIASLIWLYQMIAFVQVLKLQHDISLQNRPQRIHGSDISQKLQLATENMIRMGIEESIHFALDNSSRADQEWSKSEPYGKGVVRDQENRPFLVSMFHELHCLHYLGAELGSKNKDHWPHTQHCLNMLRQWILCEADVTLEAGDFADKDFSSDRQGETHMCRNWEVVYQEMKNNWVGWYRYQVEQGIIQVDERI
ncbi:hypothetical protein K435DRAFT_973658 [Dendrothele bispora CBS 962.96]|uniref:Uncharacterized protein n=1 Tax=Dendrothele bispora (strain CBS 962.96) TaxID=1314807 RepID=A0A4S8KR98_DENBC|nr:hypothetical protein K435DRAFT_973658 [Dendrothele bispora CBS 962.96]